MKRLLAEAAPLLVVALMLGVPTALAALCTGRAT